MPKVELKRLVGQFREATTGKVRSLGWNMDQLFLDGRQIATINHVPGAGIGLFPGVMLTPAERAEVIAVVASARDGVKPSKISGPVELPYELLDEDDDIEETDVDDE